ncbi:hypothetical protein ACFL6L_01000 [candidate division KSB1 bacterium]
MKSMQISEIFSLRIRKILIIFILFCIIPLNSYAEDRGGYAGVFLRLGLGARAKALGGAYVGNSIDGYSGYYNPAGLGSLQNREVYFSYRSMSLDRTFRYVGVALPMPPMAGMSVGWIHAGTENIDGRDFSGNHTKMYTDSQNGFLFGFGLQLPGEVNIGVGGTYLRETLLDVTATGFGINLGILYRPLPYLSLGAAARDIRAHYAWNTESLYERGSSINDDFPEVYTFGTALTVNKYNTEILCDLYKNSKSETGVRFGIENTLLSNIDIRAGIDDGDFTAGVGIHFPLPQSNVGRLDYALVSSDIDPESVHIFSLSLQF